MLDRFTGSVTDQRKATFEHALIRIAVKKLGLRRQPITGSADLPTNRNWETIARIEPVEPRPSVAQHRFPGNG